MTGHTRAERILQSFWATKGLRWDVLVFLADVGRLLVSSGYVCTALCRFCDCEELVRRGREGRSGWVVFVDEMVR